jgi:hypothetical protein
MEIDKWWHIPFPIIQALPVKIGYAILLIAFSGGFLIGGCE